MSDIQRKQTVSLLAFSVVSFVLSYATAIVFARALGATGAAVSYAIPVIALYVTMGTVATRELRKGTLSKGPTGRI